MHISPTIHYSAGHSYKNQDFFVNPFGSDVISPNYNYVSVHVSVQVLVEAHAVEQHFRSFRPYSHLPTAHSARKSKRAVKLNKFCSWEISLTLIPKIF